MEKLNIKVSNTQLHDMILFFLKEHNQGSLATTINNIPRSSPVMFFMGNDMNIYIISAGGDKFKAIRENTNVCLLVNTDYLDYKTIKGVQIFGIAQVGEMGDDIYQEAEKYCSDRHLLNENEMKIIKICPKEIVYLDSTKNGDRTKQTLYLE